jgi:hypothetical protein
MLWAERIRIQQFQSATRNLIFRIPPVKLAVRSYRLDGISKHSRVQGTKQVHNGHSSCCVLHYHSLFFSVKYCRHNPIYKRRPLMIICRDERDGGVLYKFLASIFIKMESSNDNLRWRVTRANGSFEHLFGPILNLRRH